MHLEEQEKSLDTKYIHMKYDLDMSPKQKVRIKDRKATARKWQKQEKLSGVSLVLQFIVCLRVSENSSCLNLDGQKSIV